MVKSRERSPLLRHAESHPTMHLAYQTRKRLGDAVEAAFLAKAAGLFFQVAKPWGEDVRYDFLVDAGRGIWRVQVKAATSFDGSRYNVRAGGASKLYTPDEIDFLAAHVVGENAWYMIPVEAAVPRTGLHLYPHDEGSKGQFEKYREGWCLMLCPRNARGWGDIPVQCRYPKLPVRCAVCPCGKE